MKCMLGAMESVTREAAWVAMGRVNSWQLAHSDKSTYAMKLHAMKPHSVERQLDIPSQPPAQRHISSTIRQPTSPV